MTFGGFCSAIVEKLPMPISISPSPVMTRTGTSVLAEGNAKSDHCSATHCAPEAEIPLVIPGRANVVGGRAEAGHDDEILAVLQQACRRLCLRSSIVMLPDRSEYFCADQTLRQQDRRRRAAVEYHRRRGFHDTGSTSAASLARCHANVHETENIRRALPIGTCQGFTSPHSPRMATIVRKGVLQMPDQGQHVDTVSDAARLHEKDRVVAANPCAGGKRHAFFFGRESDRAHRVIFPVQF